MIFFVVISKLSFKKVFGGKIVNKNWLLKLNILIWSVVVYGFNNKLVLLNSVFWLISFCIVFSIIKINIKLSFIISLLKVESGIVFLEVNVFVWLIMV